MEGRKLGEFWSFFGFLCSSLPAGDGDLHFPYLLARLKVYKSGTD